MADLQIGVIGTGEMGTRHAHNLHRLVAGARVAGVYDLDQARAAHVAADCGGAHVFSDPVELIQDAGIEAVVIVSPDPTHAAFVQHCLRVQKPVLCEKPLATTSADALAIVQAEQALGRRLIGVGFMRRFDPRHVAVKNAVAAGEIGRPFLFKGVHRNPKVATHLPGSIVITNSAIHDLDSTRWLLGQEITEVWVRGARTHASFSPETLDMLLFQMTLTGDCLATIECSVAIEYGYEVLAEVVGEKGAALTTSPADAVVRARKVQSLAVPQLHLDRFQDAFVPELTRWVQSIRGSQPFPGASAWDGYMASLVADACIESLQTGKPVTVATPTKPDLYAEHAVQDAVYAS